nr:hypothetical protein [Escherichia coli]
MDNTNYGNDCQRTW